MVRFGFLLYSLARVTRLLYWLLRSRIGLLLFWSIHYSLELENVVLTFWQNANQKVHVWMMLTYLDYYLTWQEAGKTWRVCVMDDTLRPLINAFKFWVILQQKWILWVETNFRPC